MEKYKLIDLFAGAGGLSNGFEQTGKFEVVGAVEINKEAVQTYIYNHGNNPNIIIKPGSSDISDITKINFRHLLKEKNINNDEIVVIGGPPCQGFSNANRQRNYIISGNNQLVKEYARAIDEIRPSAFLMENVKTMKSDKHKFFVTKGISKGIHAYSSEEHLKKIIKATNKKPFWEKDELNLIETENVMLKPLISSIINDNLRSPLLTKQIHISRVRSIVRQLKKENVYNLDNSKDIQEVKSIIDYLDTYKIINFMEERILREIISDTIQSLESLVLGLNRDNSQVLDILNVFIDVNQLLRYLSELEEEQILLLNKPEIDSSNPEKLKVTIRILSYNVVEYLEVFFDFLGYNVDSDVMLASNFCTPQNRMRFMILGVRRDFIKDRPVKLPEKIQSENLPFTVFDAIWDLEKISPTTGVSDNILPYSSEGSTRMKRYFRANMTDSIIYNHINTASMPLSRQRFKALKENNGKNFHSLSTELKEISYTDVSRTQNTVYLRLKYNAPSPTVINVRKSMWQHPEKPESLSIREAARLQSFRDDFIFRGTKDKQYQQIGNAVPPLLARAVAEQLLFIIGEEPLQPLRTEFDI